MLKWDRYSSDAFEMFHTNLSITSSVATWRNKKSPMPNPLLHLFNTCTLYQRNCCNDVDFFSHRMACFGNSICGPIFFRTSPIKLWEEFSTLTLCGRYKNLSGCGASTWYQHFFSESVANIVKTVGHEETSQHSITGFVVWTSYICGLLPKTLKSLKFELKICSWRSQHFLLDVLLPTRPAILICYYSNMYSEYP